jgi:integrase
LDWAWKVISLDRTGGLVRSSTVGTRLEQQTGKQSVRQGLPHWRRAAGQDGEKRPSISAHDLQQTCATLARRRPAPMEVVSKVLGQARMPITLNVHRHLVDNERKALVVDLFGVLRSALAALN